MTSYAKHAEILSLWGAQSRTEIESFVRVARYMDWEKMNVAERWSGSGPRPRLGLKEDNQVMDNTYGELECPLCGNQNMKQVGQFTTGSQKGDIGPHMKCQRCFGDSVWVGGR